VRCGHRHNCCRCYRQYGVLAQSNSTTADVANEHIILPIGATYSKLLFSDMRESLHVYQGDNHTLILHLGFGVDFGESRLNLSQKCISVQTLLLNINSITGYVVKTVVRFRGIISTLFRIKNKDNNVCANTPNHFLFHDCKIFLNLPSGFRSGQIFGFVFHPSVAFGQDRYNCVCNNIEQ
jgi:hypothetical protein